MAQILPENQVDQLGAEHRALFDLLAVSLEADVDGLVLGGANQRHAAVDQRHGGIGAHGFRKVEHPLVALGEDYISVRIQKECRQIYHIKNACNFQGNSMVEVHILSLPFWGCARICVHYIPLCANGQANFGCVLKFQVNSRSIYSVCTKNRPFRAVSYKWFTSAQPLPALRARRKRRDRRLQARRASCG